MVNLKRAATAGTVTFECPKCTSNVIVETDGREGLLVNTIGAYTGKKLINIADGGMTTTISIRAKGSWKMTVAGIDKIEMVTGKPATGKGDSVFMMTGGFKSARVTNQGKSNFVVTYVDLSTSSLGLAINEIGSYQGTVLLPGRCCLDHRSSRWSRPAAGRSRPADHAVPREPKPDALPLGLRPEHRRLPGTWLADFDAAAV